MDLDALADRILLAGAVAQLTATHEDDDVLAQRPLLIEHIAPRGRVQGEVLLERFY
jgi:hypothetical protein